MKRIALITIIISLLGLTACATGDSMFLQGFGFDTFDDSPGVEVLDYQYGSSNQFGLHPDKERVALGQPFHQWHIFGGMPRADFLYVQWRIKQSGEVYEDKVDLTHRLPQDMKFYELHFLIKGEQLYVYLVPPRPPHVGVFNDPHITPATWDPSAYRKSFADKSYAEYIKKLQIYPDQAK